MRRFTSLQHVPSETRRILRDRFTRYLPSHRTTPFNNPNAPPHSDEELLQLLFKSLVNGDEDSELANATCQTPEWVAARLWDRGLGLNAGSSIALRAWLKRWNRLGQPMLTPARAWGETAAGTFRAAALDMLESGQGLLNWEEFRSGIIERQALAGNLSVSEVEANVLPVPANLIDRALWLERPAIERALFVNFDGDGDILGIASPLLADIEGQENSPVPNPMASRLFTFAAAHPAFFFGVLLRIRQYPALMADLLLHPPTSALACLLVARWQPTSGAWDRELRTRDDQSTKAIAFADATAVLADFLQQGSVPPEEVSSLLAWMYEDPGYDAITNSGGNGSMLATLRGVLTEQSPQILGAIVSPLMSSVKSGLGTSRFAAALDVIDAGKLAGDIDPVPIVSAYVQSVAAGPYTLSARKLGPSGAAALFELASRAPSGLRRNFLFPIDEGLRLAAGKEAGENLYTVKDNLAQSIRAHIRVLSRAVSALEESAPDDLVDALVRAVQTAATSDEEKDRIGAFAPRYESGPYVGAAERPIAADLGGALMGLATKPRERLLTAILETDQPAVLAQLLSFAPHALRGRIEQRITALTPSESGEIQLLTEAQARIEELLSAGLGDSAARFMEAERDLKPWGNIPGRELTRLRAVLRLYLLRRDWTAIAQFEVPQQLSQAEQGPADEMIRFFRALAAIKDPAGDVQGAEQALMQLQGRRPDVAAYAINLFAARISLLLKPDSFAEFAGKELLRARRALIEAEQMMLHARVLSDSDSEAFICNKALLLLALGQPDRVIELLASIRTIRLGDTIAAYKAVALARMGSTQDAIAILNNSSRELGESDVLRAARAHIQSGQPFVANPSTSSDEDPLPRVKVAFFDLLQMDHFRQAEALEPAPEPFDAFVIGHVRSAAASVIGLKPMMKVTIFDSCEDDVSALIRELLISRLQFLKWSVADQSRTGYTALENAGEADLLLKKDSTVLAVIEAVVCNRPMTQEWARKELTSHFQKLVAYAPCKLFFHLTYSNIDNPASIIEHLKKTAEQDAPEGFAYRLREDIPFTDSRPVGFIARYRGEFGEVKIVFLVLNMGQRHHKAAAKTAAKSNPRKKKNNSKSKSKRKQG